LDIPGAIIHMSPPHWIDIRAGIKADGFDFYAINCKPYGLPINRPQFLNSLLSRLFSFASMRFEGLRLDCLPSL